MDININTTERLQHAETDLYDQYDHIDPWVVVTMRYKDGAVIRLFVESEDDLATWIRVLEDAHARLSTARKERFAAALNSIADVEEAGLLDDADEHDAEMADEQVVTFGCPEHGPECVTAGDHAEFLKGSVLRD
jgi:hypothetical protein